jgi:uncharacterized repeat protein (TIGR04138 family)
MLLLGPPLRPYLARRGFDTLNAMPPPAESQPPEKPLPQIVEEVGLYPIEAFEFVQQGLSYTVTKLHGEVKDLKEEKVSRHVTGQDLCDGLREFALMNWGLLARTVLARWNVRKTLDFGRIVFALVDNGYMQKTQDDTIDDFRDVFDFKSAFENYKIESHT